jgi:hypothetical protein
VTRKFVVYWVPKLRKSRSNVITFANQSYAAVFPMKIEPASDTVIRVFMLYQPLSAGERVEVEPLELKAPSRVGFTVVEWGGGKIMAATRSPMAMHAPRGLP